MLVSAEKNVEKFWIIWLGCKGEHLVDLQSLL